MCVCVIEVGGEGCEELMGADVTGWEWPRLDFSLRAPLWRNL